MKEVKICSTAILAGSGGCSGEGALSTDETVGECACPVGDEACDED